MTQERTSFQGLGGPGQEEEAPRSGRLGDMLDVAPTPPERAGKAPAPPGGTGAMCSIARNSSNAHYV